MPMVPLPKHPQFFYISEYLAIGKAIFGEDQNSWQYICPNCGLIFTKKEASDWWAQHEGVTWKTARICHKCNVPDIDAELPYESSYYQVLAMPSDFPKRNDIGPNGSMFRSLPFYHEHASLMELVGVLAPYYEARLPRGTAAPKPRPTAGFDLNPLPVQPPPVQAAPEPPPPPPPPAPPKVKGGPSYGFKF